MLLNYSRLFIILFFFFLFSISFDEGFEAMVPFLFFFPSNPSLRDLLYAMTEFSFPFITFVFLSSELATIK
jgi:hypothetical protein